MGFRGYAVGIALSMVVISACSKPQRSSDDTQASLPSARYESSPTDSTDSGALESRRSADVTPGPPRIGPSAAPGVAFAYKYSFQLTDGKISAVQEAHAAKCEALGLAKCRIVGLNYTIGDDDTVSATLDLKLDPEIARSYGRDATGVVTQAGGRLSHTEFTGEDTAPTTEVAVAAGSDAETRIADVQRRLAQPGIKDFERSQLQSQLEALRSQANDAKATLVTNRAKLASTPMSFAYYGKGGINGFAGRDPLLEAEQSFVASLVAMITFVLQLLAFVVPWLILLGLLVLLWRSPPVRALVRWARNTAAKERIDERAEPEVD